ncbi:hypothetical protein CANARDRAFT_176012 [[Candida] arabinofermentans NRRL YB-2248]|uniref:phosphoinositide 5-phosphatase n=1 Tax=[Candida] arabinofermentans NRRL YB-2248 TaxID=983967 RepID=A0A1E4T1D7_9ASCO|nr:hypothetical protein CANARDRAFT_176012 [[Candida] arabinofermentans NRRL YB-2248]
MRILVNTSPERTLALESESHVLLFRYIPKIGQCAIELVRRDQFNHRHYRSMSKHKPMGFLGLIEQSGHIFLAVISGKVDVACPVQGELINKIMDVEFHCLTKDSWDFLELNANGYPAIESEDGTAHAAQSRYEQNPCYELRKLLCDGSFFYSSDFDLTSTLQTRGIDSKNSLSKDRYHLDYMWNSFMMEEIISFRNNLDEEPKLALDSNKFLTTVIRGFAETLRASVGGMKVFITIISKQSWKRAGTRFNVRGVDDDGNVANFVETELIYNDGRYVFAYTQIRGSIPMFWEQDTALISPKVQITRSFDATQPSFDKHFENLNGKYGPVHIVNLLSATKAGEIELSTKYKKHFFELDRKTPDSVSFTNFDFHQETSKTYAHASKVLRDLEPSLEDFGYYLYDTSSKELIMEQQGVFRTNCLDCLDRTNVVQQVISIAALEDFLKSFRKGDPFDLKNKHSSLWADHGDQISQIYTGTNALKSSFSRSGKMGFAGALSDATKSISRIYINNFVDKGKQVVTDTLLGKNSNQVAVAIFDPVTEYIQEESRKCEHQFTTYENITIFVGTYNLAGSSRAGDLSKWLFPSDNGGSKFSPDVVIVGFQEVVELNAANILKNDQSISRYWQGTVERELNQVNPNNRYVLLRAEYMSSVLILFYVKSNNVSKVTQVEGKSKKTGLGGMTANKGSVAIRFNYGSSTFCFFNSHLAAGTTNVDERYNDFITTWNAIRFSRNRQIKHHDNIIWLGDLNYRISKENNEVRAMIDSGNLQNLLEYDQLCFEMKRRTEMRGFKEMPITFAPTYKYDKGTSQYDSSEKQRVPSWTDRILYRGSQIQQLNYNCAQDLVFSDHKPVFGTFAAHVKLIDEEIKSQLTRKLYQQYKESAVGSKGLLIELNEPYDDSEAELKSIASSTGWSSSSDPTLIEVSGNSSTRMEDVSDTPRLPNRTSQPPSVPQRPRRVPPPYDPKESHAMLLPGLSSSLINTHQTQSQHAPPVPPHQRAASSEDRAATSPSPGPRGGYSLSVMQPTRSASSSPAPQQQKPSLATLTSQPALKTNTPPLPPPRRGTATTSPTQPEILNRANSRSSVSSGNGNGKVTPMVPSKPKALLTVHTGSVADTGTQTAAQPVDSELNKWAPMVPNKKL